MADDNLQRRVVIQLDYFETPYRSTQIHRLEFLDKGSLRFVPIQNMEVSIAVAEYQFVFPVGVDIGGFDGVIRAYPAAEAAAPRFGEIIGVGIRAAFVGCLRQLAEHKQGGQGGENQHRPRKGNVSFRPWGGIHAML